MKKIISVIVVIFIITAWILYIKGNSSHDFSAKSVKGDVTLKDFGEKHKILYFGYLACPDVCPATLGILASVLNELKRDDIVVLFVSLDPERDTVNDLDDYAKYFYPNSYGILANNLPKVAKTFKVKYQKVLLEKSAMEYSVAHSSSIYLLDKNGKFVSEVSNLTVDNIKNAIKELISK